MNDSKFLKTNYHTHSTFCDGKASPEEMVKTAIEKNFDILGFSGHSMIPFASSWHIPCREHKPYADEVRKLAVKYKDKIEICLGFEADFIEGICSPNMENFSLFKPDYLIGSVHYVPGNKGYFEADGGFEETRERIKKYFGGNVKKAVQAYFSSQREMLSKGDFNIWGHPDLIRKQNAKSILFREDEIWYKKELKSTAKVAAAAGVCAEINTGGMARGYLSTPYPSLQFLEILHSYNIPITIDSDAHTPENLDYSFEDAKSLAKKAGYTEIEFYTAGSWKFQKLS